ncbi:class I SAM-dependent methyltransferase [Microbacterium sp. Marseille-Q6965]|uniref:class I SAM-dependent methyltransferase n=1 Tax=Microbacterium sp. Marseille-Q6965 TaxID=2965072 RepID=UPI0021B7C322|nr:class I SAM-dependent methyltransferase [Microbacterium sp. Marseille-Q6965]
MTPHADAALCRALAADLAAARFRTEALRAAWGVEADDATGRGLRQPALRGLGDRRDALAVLARLLVFGVAQPRDDVDRALPTLRADGLEDLGLAERDGDLVAPRAIIRPQSFHDDRGPGEWWIASDLDELARGGGALAEDHVLGVGGASLTLAGLQLPTPAGRVLDLGTGCGIQALRAGRYADHIVATDISERALAFTRLNALLNGADGVEARAGSLFEPVDGERFDRIVSNPPFVITPRVAGVPAYEYRDGGLVGDALVEAVITGAGRHLRPGGVAQLLANWETRDGVAGLDRVRTWVAASPVALDAWIVEREELDPIRYAEMWIRDGGTAPGSPGFDALLAAWLDDFAARGVTAIGFGYVLLRRAEGAPTLARYERVTHPIPSEGALGSHLAAALAQHDRAAALDDAALAAARFRTAPDVTEARHHRPGEEAPSVIELRQGGGFGRSVQADPALAGLLGACDGELPAGALIDAIAQLLEADAAALRAALLPTIRELLLDGFLTFAD